MGLDDFTTESESADSSIKTRKQIENVELEERFWDLAVEAHPDLMYTAAMFTDESSAKAIVQKMDEAINNNIKDINVNDELAKELKQYKQEIIEDLEL